MEQNRDELAEFFRMSMESFQDVPSDAVWQKIDGKLASEITIWSTLVHFITKYFFVFLLGSISILYLSYSQFKFNSLANELELIKEEFQNLEFDYNKMNARYSELELEYNKSVSYVNKLKEDFELQGAHLHSFEREVHKLTESNRSLLSQYSNMDFNKVTTEKLYSSPLYFGKPLNTNVFERKDFLEYQNKYVGSNSENKIELQSKNNRVELGQSNAAKESIVLAEIRSGFDWSKKTKAYMDAFQQYISNKIAQSKTEIIVAGSHQFKYAYGFNISTINVITNSSDKRNFGISFGLMHELKIKEHWFLTNGLSINNTNYEIANDADLLSLAELANVPGESTYQESVKEVEVNSQYLDFSIGIARRFNNHKDQSAWFVNPSLAWQFYFPQEYLYTFTDGSKTLYDDKRFIGYFGTAKLLIGYQKPLYNNVQYKIGVYGEKSFVEQGKELRHRFNVGLSGSILFGN